MDLTVLALRVAVSLAVVLGLVWFLARAARRRGLGSGADGQRFSVVGRHSLGRNAGVTVVRVGDEALVLGVTEQSVQLLARTDLAAVSGASPRLEAPQALRIDSARRIGLPREGVTLGAPAPARLVDPQGARTALPLSSTGLSSSGLSSSGLSSSGKASALSGSALSPGTWSSALEALRERTTRR